MRLRLAGVIALCVFASLATAFARAPQAGQNPTGPPPPPLVTTGLIVGRVIDAGTGRPVSGVIVVLNGGPARVAQPVQGPQPPAAGRAAFPAQPPRVLTDSDGNFAFRNLTRGNYTITTTKAGYTGGAYGRNRPDGQLRSIPLDDNERVADAVIKIFKYASINGRITDETGEPIVAADVKAYRRALSSGRRRLVDAGQVRTDDRGVYRIGNLAPGEYVVAAPLSSATGPTVPAGANELNMSLSSIMLTNAPPSFGGPGRTVGPDGRFTLQSDNAAVSQDALGRWRGYATHYYPASRQIASAEVIALPSGEERTGVDIQMRYVPVSTISGTLMTPSGERSGMVLRLIPADGDAMLAEPETASAMTDSTGAFVFAGVPSGQYVIKAVRVAREPPQFAEFARGAEPLTFTAKPVEREPPPPLLWANVQVTVADDDVTGVQVVMQEGFTIAGRYEFTGSKPRPDGQRLAQIPVSIEPADGRDFISQGPPSRSMGDGRFITTYKAPGKYFMRIGGAPPGFIVQSVLVNGINVTDVPFDLTANVTNAVVMFTDQIASVGGTVRGIEPGDDPPLVVLFPADPRVWRDFGWNPMRMKSARAVQPGTFTFNSLTAGDYLAAAIPDIYSGEWQDPAYLELLAPAAERVSVLPGGKHSISLQVTSVKPPGAGRDRIALLSRASRGAADIDTYISPAATIEQPDGSNTMSSRPQTQTRDTRPVEPKGAGSISGTVTIADGSSRPARLARVRLTNSAAGIERTVLTGDDGRYVFPSLPAGLYSLVVTKPAFLSMNYGSRRPGLGPGSLVRVDEGKAVTSIDVALSKGAVITGRVFDEMGQPAAAVRMQLMTFTRREGERVLTNASQPSGTVTTDDRGEYRFYGLRPGKYVVMASPTGATVNQELRQLSNDEMRAAIAEASRSPVPVSVLNSVRTIAPAPPVDPPAVTAPGRPISYSPVYYPGTTSATQAAEVTLGLGEEMTDIAIPLRMVPASRVEGRVIGPDGQIAGEAQVQLVRITGTGTSSTGVRFQRGMFQATGVPAGRYTLAAMLEMSGRGAAAAVPGGRLFAQMEIDLNGDDLLGLVLPLAPLPTITGRVVFDGAPAPAANAVQVSLEPAAGGLTSLGFGETRPATTDENGVFTLNGVMPGRYRLNARVVSRPSPTPAPQPGQVAAPNVQNAVTTAPGWTVLASRISGQDAFVSLFEVRAGESLTDAEIVLTNKPADISGKLIDAADKPVPNMTVVLFPADRSLWLANASRVNRISRPNATGTFSFPNAVPGEYYLAVLTELDNADWAEPEFKEQLEAAAIKVTVAKGEKKVLDFRIGGPPPLSGPFESPAR